MDSFSLAGERTCKAASCLYVWKSLLCKCRIFDSSSIVLLADILEGGLSKPASVKRIVARLSEAVLL